MHGRSQSARDRRRTGGLVNGLPLPRSMHTDAAGSVSRACCARRDSALRVARAVCRAARPGIKSAGTLSCCPGQLPVAAAGPGKGGLTLPTWKGLLHASAAVYGLRGSRGPHMGRRSRSAREAGADPDRCPGGQR